MMSFFPHSLPPYCIAVFALQTWIDELTRLGSTDIVIALAGNKSDLNDKREVLTSEAKGTYVHEDWNGCS